MSTSMTSIASSASALEFGDNHRQRLADVTYLSLRDYRLQETLKADDRRKPQRDARDRSTNVVCSDDSVHSGEC